MNYYPPLHSLEHLMTDANRDERSPEDQKQARTLVQIYLFDNFLPRSRVFGYDIRFRFAVILLQVDPTGVLLQRMIFVTISKVIAYPFC